MPASDSRALFVGMEAHKWAGVIMRDLFQHDDADGPKIRPYEESAGRSGAARGAQVFEQRTRFVRSRRSAPRLFGCAGLRRLWRRGNVIREKIAARCANQDGSWRRAARTTIPGASMNKIAALTRRRLQRARRAES